jgi:hypothetical protein
MALLEGEVEHLEDSEVTLGSDSDIDLLLGTQGWRRFIVQDKFLQERGMKAERVLGVHKARARIEYASSDESCDEDLECCEDEMEENEEEEMEEEKGMKEEKIREEVMKEEAPMKKMKEEAPMIEKQRDAPMKKKEEEDAPMKKMAAREEEDVPMRKAKKREEAAPMKKRIMAEPMQLKQDLMDIVLADRDMKMPDIQDDIETQPVIREYAHKVKPNRKAGDRTDFAETVYWNANIATDANGEATVTFDLSDSVTSFRAFADAFVDTRLGTGTVLFESKNPFYMEPKLPLEVTYGDVIHLPIALVNESSEQLKGTVKPVIHGTGLKIDPNADLKFTLKAGERQRKVLTVTVGDVAELAKLQISATSGALSDSVTRPLRIVPTGFPFRFGAGGLLERNSTATHRFTIPASVVANSFETNVKVFCTPASTLTESLKSFITEPCGCFEQTSMTSYPLVMVLQYFKTHLGVDPKLVEAANENLAKGYKRLTSYEVKNGGYEWFGSSPAHEG